MTSPLTLKEAAVAVGLSVERFRKCWKDWVKTRGFPAPFTEPHEACRWDAEAVTAWKRNRAALRAQALTTGRVGSGGGADDRGPTQAPPANDPAPPRAPAAVLAADRAAVAGFMRRTAR